MKLGELLVENDVPPYDGTDTWVELLLRDPAHRAAVAREVKAVAAEIAADPRYGDEQLGPDDEARERFREFARKLPS
jgi:sugar phosphate isomerase/epimerase